jgi:hypothetical protein
MLLARLSWLVLTPGTDVFDGLEFRRDQVVVRFGPDITDEKTSRRLFVAEVPLARRPSSRNGLIAVPEAERLHAEEALEATSDFLSVATGSRRELLSPAGFAVAFHPDEGDQEEAAWLESHDGVEGASEGRVRARFHPKIPKEVLPDLEDREDGVALLAEAHSQTHETGRFRELVRFFERAFASKSDALVVHLARFLTARPVLAYSKSEVKNWIVRLRGPAVHADRSSAFMREREIAWVVDRMLLAAYEVLLNKERWAHPASDRRDLWTPQYGPADPDGVTIFGVAGREMSPAVSFLDQFGAFPINLSLPKFELPSPHWPRRSVRMEWPHPLRVINADQLATCTD